jgi:hypothetical protein
MEVHKPESLNPTAKLNHLIAMALAAWNNGRQ